MGSLSNRWYANREKKSIWGSWVPSPKKQIANSIWTGSERDRRLSFPQKVSQTSRRIWLPSSSTRDSCGSTIISTTRIGKRKWRTLLIASIYWNSRKRGMIPSISMIELIIRELYLNSSFQTLIRRELSHSHLSQNSINSSLNRQIKVLQTSSTNSKRTHSKWWSTRSSKIQRARNP